MKNSIYIIISAVSSIIVFLLLFLWFNVILDSNIGFTKNIVLSIFSIIIGVVLYILLIYKQYIFITIFSLGIVTSFIMMCYNFKNNSMFGDIIGIIDFLTTNLIGISLGILGQCIYYLLTGKRDN